ncbi:MAG TPA: DEDD exonuclease domain-containing protein [Acidimicrobiales bacterium]|nr:DEDD exonuclease domain-containing protein [Acidimicrobiales bacterium]
MPAPAQRSFDDLGTPLHDVTFCVVDLETTGGSAADCAITEIGAVKLRGGESVGTFATLVNPGTPVPPFITVLTGITEAMVRPAPRIEAVLPSFLEFAAGTVLVAHNARFDVTFLDTALVRHGYPRLANPVVDTCALARRLVRDEVRNCKLATLAEHYRLPHQPSHRALADALATGDLLHVLLERAGSLGVLGLDDLLSLPTIVGHPEAGKLRLTDGLPRTPGVYLFRDRGGRVLYVGKATNLRTRVRSYFSGDQRRKVGQLLRETVSVDHIPTTSALEAAVLEVRLIHRHLPRFNRQSTTWRRYAYLKLTLGERFPRLSVVKAVRDDGALYLGPLSSSSAARRLADAIECAAPLRRCTARPTTRVLRGAACAPAQLGVATCPCAGDISEADYAAIVDHVVHGLTVDPSVLLGVLEGRMRSLAVAERYEEAAEMRERAATLAGAIARQRRLDGLRRAGRLVVALPDGARAELVGGVLSLAWVGDQPSLPASAATPAPLVVPGAPLDREAADEVACVAAWLDKEAHRVRVVSCDGELTSPVVALPRFQPVEPVVAGGAAAKRVTVRARPATSSPFLAR